MKSLSFQNLGIPALSVTAFLWTLSADASEPWSVETVSPRVGVDTDNDAEIDQWTNWAEIRESYDYTPGFSKQVRKTPARLDLSDLPAGYGFQIEMKMTDATENASKPIVEALRLSFQ